MKHFATIGLLGAALFLGNACASAPKSGVPDNPLVGAWAANGIQSRLPANAEALLALWADGSYSISTRFGGNDSEAKGSWMRVGETLVFDEKTKYRYALDELAGTLVLTAPDGAKIRYERVRFEAERTSGGERRSRENL